MTRQVLALGLSAALGCGAWLALAGPFPGSRAEEPPLLNKLEPIEAADARLRRQGWQPISEPPAESFDRELSGNSLSSLRACSGTGAGYCRYDYRRQGQRLEVITVPNRDGDGQVVRWILEAAGPAAP
jgi:hypothetical protein